MEYKAILFSDIAEQSGAEYEICELPFHSESIGRIEGFQNLFSLHV